MKNIIVDLQLLKDKVERLERYSHPKKEFVRCKECQERIKASSKLMQSTGDEPI